MGVDIILLDRAYHLAVGAFGWFKSSSRSSALLDIIALRGGSLMACSTFSGDAYLVSRQRESMVRGVLVQNNIIKSIDLPKASTALNNDSGQICLRALTTGLLAFFDPEITVSMLQDLIP